MILAPCKFEYPHVNSNIKIFDITWAAKVGFPSIFEFSCTRSSGPKFLPFESVTVVLDGIKLTTDVGPEVRYRLGKEDAERFYTKARDVVRGTNRGGLGWSSQRFHSVAWQSLEAALKSKPDMFQIWLSKQCNGICATQRNMARIQDILDDKCPNCLRPREKMTILTNVQTQAAQCSSKKVSRQ